MPQDNNEDESKCRKSRKTEKCKPCKDPKPSDCKESPREKIVICKRPTVKKGVFKPPKAPEIQKDPSKLSLLQKELAKYLPDIKLDQLSFQNVKNWIIQNCNPKKLKEMANEKPAAGSGRPMKFPYTYSAKFAQFPFRFYVQNQWIWKYYCISVVACIPVFAYIHRLSNSPGNVAAWAEIRRKEAEEHHH